MTTVRVRAYQDFGMIFKNVGIVSVNESSLDKLEGRLEEIRKSKNSNIYYFKLPGTNNERCAHSIHGIVVKAYEYFGKNREAI